MIDRLRQDLRYAIRVLTRQWGFTLAAIVTVAVGAGANATMFSLVNAALLRPLPVAEPDRLVNLHSTNAESRFGNFSHVEYRALRERSRTLSEIAAYNEVTAILQTGNFSDRIAGEVVSANYFAATGLRPLLGRFFTPDEDQVANPTSVMVISHSIWQRVFHEDRGVVGKAVRLNGHNFTIIGVAPAHYRGLLRGVDYSFWAPLAVFRQIAPETSSNVDRFAEPTFAWLEVFGRLSSGATTESAAAELSALRKQFQAEIGSAEQRPGVDVFKSTGLPDHRRGTVVLFVAILGALGALVLLIACVNLAGMLLAQALTRSGEVALRRALGASRARIMGALALESGLVLLAGCAVGLLAASWTAGLFLRFQPPVDVPLIFDLSVDHRVLFITLGLTTSFGMLLGLVPALQSSNADINSILRSAGRSLHGRSARARRLLVSAQIAVSLVLVIAAGLFGRAMQRAQAIDPGFDPKNVVAVAIDPGPDAATPEGLVQFYDALVERLRRRPDVEGVSLARALPLGQSRRAVMLRIPGKEAEPGQPIFNMGSNSVSPGYFATLRIPVLRGREFNASDRSDSPPVGVISAEFARRIFPGDDPVGQTVIDNNTGARIEIVGVIADVKFRSLQESPQLFLYRPVSQSSRAGLILHVRSSDPAGMLRTIPAEVRALLSSAATFQAASLERQINFLLIPQRIASTVTMILGALGVLLAGLGLHAVIAFWLVQRKRELAVRAALGAQPADLMRIVLNEGLRVALMGGVIGTAVAMLGTRVLRSFLFGVSPLDPIVYVGALTSLLLLVVIACAAPLRRTLRLQPMRVLRDDG
jgi:predicted permease